MVSHTMGYICPQSVLGYTKLWLSEANPCVLLEFFWSIWRTLTIRPLTPSWGHSTLMDQGILSGENLFVQTANRHEWRSRATGVAPHEWCICSSRLLMNKYRQTLHVRSCWEFNFALKLLQESRSICHFLGDFWSELVLIYTGWMVGTCPVCPKTKDQESWTLELNIIDCDHAQPIGAYCNTKWILGETKCTSLLDHTHSSLNNIVLRLLLIVHKLIQIPSAYSKWSSYLFKSLSCPWFYPLPQLPQAWPSNLSGEHQLGRATLPLLSKDM